MKSFTKFSMNDFALYIAKLYDLDANEMNNIIKWLEDNNVDEVLNRYGDKMASEAITILSHDYSNVADFEYYEIVNTTDEWHTTVTGMYATLADAKEGLKNACDWYRPNGTGTIYVVRLKTKANGAVEKHRKEVYSV